MEISKFDTRQRPEPYGADSKINNISPTNPYLIRSIKQLNNILENREINNVVRREIEETIELLNKI